MMQDENGDDYVLGDWKCVSCRGKKTRIRLWLKDWVGDRNEDGIRLGLCHECQKKITEAIPEVRNAQASLQARLAVEKGTPRILQQVRRFEETPGWWEKLPSYPKSR